MPLVMLVQMLFRPFRIPLDHASTGPFILIGQNKVNLEIALNHNKNWSVNKNWCPAL